MKAIQNKNILYFLLLFVILAASIIGQTPSVDARNFEAEKKNIQKKIIELKKKEKVEINKLTQTQKKLETTNDNIKSCVNRLQQSKANMSRLEKKLISLNSEQEKLAYAASKRIREIYKGERVTLLHAIFESKDLSSFLDRMYYQKAIIKKDQELLSQLREKSRQINNSKRRVEDEKQNIASTINVMQKKKQSLNESITTSQYLINKLRTDRATYERAQDELESLSRNIEQNIASTRTNDIARNTFIRPVFGAITSPFGPRRHPIFNTTRFHSGVDIAGPNTTPIKASNSGRVIHSGWYGGYGKVVIVNHGTLKEGPHTGRGVSTLYAHLSSISVGVGSYVRKGDIVGYEGSTGYSTGPHLHFEVRIDGKPMNPMRFIGY